MVDKLSVSIALLGGDEVQRQLAGIGAAGQKAFADIDAAAEKVGGFQNLDPKVAQDAFKKFGVTSVAELNKIKAAVAKAADFEKLVQGIQAAEAAFQRFGTTISAFGARLTPLGLVVAGFGAAFIKASIDAANSIEKISTEAAKLGLTTEQFDRIHSGFEQIGISGDVAAKGLQQFQSVIDKVNAERIKTAFADLQQIIQSSGKAFAEGSTKLAFLREVAQGVGPVADAAREALQKLGVVSPLKPLSESLGPIQNALKNAGLAIDDFSQGAAKIDSTKLKAFIDELEKLGPSVQRDQAVLALFADEFGAKLNRAFRLDRVVEFKEGLGSLTRETQRQADLQSEALDKLIAAKDRFLRQFAVSEKGATFLDAVREDLEQFGRDLQANAGVAQQWVDRIKAIIQGALSGELFTAMFEQLKTDLTTFKNFLAELVTTPIAGAWQWLVTTLDGILEQLKAKFADFFNSLKEQAGQGIASGAELGSFGDTGGGGSFAGGGIIRGRGTGTSDSNLAWVSRGEHIMPALAVQQPGVLAFLEALRRSGGNLRAVLDGMGRFALGGMVMPRTIPALAAGGLLGGGSRNLGTLTLNLPDGTRVSGLTEESIVSALRRASAMSQVRSGGRKPSRYS